MLTRYFPNHCQGMYVCMYECMYACTLYVCVLVHADQVFPSPLTEICVCICMYVGMYVYTLYVHECMYIYTHVHACILTFDHGYTYTHICAYMHVCIYKHTQVTYI